MFVFMVSRRREKEQSFSLQVGTNMKNVHAGSNARLEGTSEESLKA